MKKSRNVDYHTLNLICRLTNSLKPREKLTVSEWADKNMILPAGSNEAGHFNVKNMPWQEEMLDAISDPEVTDVTCMTSAQIGKTTIILSGIGYYIDHEPATQLMVLPTLSLGEKFSKTRLATMIRDVSCLSDKVAAPKSKDSDNTILFKSYPGGHIVVAGANSAASLSSMPLRVIWMDEVDRFPDSAGGEGNPVLLAEKRATSFWNKKHIKTSTPTIKGHSRIEAEFNDGTMEEWCTKCPSCGTYQPYDFRRIDFDSVTMACKSCGEMIPEQEWKESDHAWIAKHPEKKSHRSFHMNELACLNVEWIDIIATFRKAKKKLDTLHETEDLQVFINTVLGECWEESSVEVDKFDDEELARRAEHYKADLPEGVLLLTAAVDVQEDRFEVEVRGWTRNYESWGIHKTEIYGNLIKDEPWDELEEYLRTTFRFEDGRELNIAGFGMDTGGHYTNQTYKWLKLQKKRGKKAYALKGFSRPGEDVQLLHKRSVVDIKDEIKGKMVVVDKTVLYIIGVDSGKDDIMRRLSIDVPGEGYCHFPSNGGRGYDKAYYQGLLAEKKITVRVRGKLVSKWVKKAGARNEPLDLFNYNYAVCELLRPIWGELESKLERGINYTKATKTVRKKRRSRKGMDL